ncbi:MAG TPA: sterol desaturase family protein [Chitinophagales bacterium]|nr:sterol desaturase family protein [Chitinophagales bacterium]HMY24492.1 sterol desaturase family protein [Chitinophagales bacterium]HMZ34918.1 sterol desaturase family protein [Chitinophagales bacterium]HNA39891.1 sterol desaturase family protein [Chitinophagales bacterium]HNF50950.1 sterol desaturase family protein [Chitinophagales bacterium]
MQLFNPFDFNDPVAYAVPGFIVLILAEFFIYYRKHHLIDKQFYKDAAASLELGIGSTIIDLAMKAIAISYLLWFYQFRIFDNLGPATIQEFATWQWHREHAYVWLLIFFLQDFIFYWYHRWAHEVRILWAAHVNHHSSEYMHFSTALRQSWLELLVKDLFYIPLAILGFHPLMIITMHQLNLIYQFLPHTESVKRLAKWYEYIFNSPAHHRVHHSSEVRYLDKNYAGILIIWDRIFGTFKEEDKTAFPVYGITTNIHTFNLLKITFHEVQNIWKDVQQAPTIKDKLNYIFQSPGWSHNGKDQRAKTLQKNLK